MMSFNSGNSIRRILARIKNRRNSPLVTLAAVSIIFVLIWSLGSGVVFAFHNITHKSAVVTISKKQSVKGTRTQVVVSNSSPSPTNSPTPTNKPSLTPTPTPTPTPKEEQKTIVSSPTPTPQTQLSPTPTTQQVSSDVQSYLLAEVNKYRQSQGLSTVQSDSNTCEFAKKRAQELASNFSHDGFKSLPYPSYSKVTENIAMNSDYTKVVPQWIASSGHAENMRADTPFVCIAMNGKYFAYEGWKP